MLLAGTAAAFAVTERLKLEPSPLSVSGFTPVFSPVCDCPTAKAQLELRLRKADRLTVEVVDRDGDVVRTLTRDRRVPGGRLVLEWNGRDDAGRLVPEAVYRPRVHLARGDRTFRLLLARRGDYRHRRLVVSYRLGEQARPFLFVNGIQRVRSKSGRGRGHIDWWGKVAGRHVPRGRYRIKLVAVDPAGNRSPQYTFSVRVR